MNRKKETYDRYAVGERIQKQRQSLGISQEALAEKIDRATKYCSDIERGICGMSVETMLAFAEYLKMSLDYMMYGIEPDCGEIKIKEFPEPVLSLERTEINRLLDQCESRQITYVLRMLELFIEATSQDMEGK
ncbi:MAG: helix-turn-helix domain-containing protein [Lachnospiraceae bacterium]|nr:helix-turn-helix domain-containing protein [Lachnospiraceae bacterium]